MVIRTSSRPPNRATSTEGMVAIKRQVTVACGERHLSRDSSVGRAGACYAPSRKFEPFSRRDPMNTKDKGELAEAAVIARLKEFGYTVLTPFGDNAKYDLVYDRNGVLIKAQVKYGRWDGERIKCNTSSTTHSKSENNISEYTKEDIDEFLIYSPHTEDVYSVAVENAGKTSKWFRLEEPDRGANNVNLAEDYVL